MSTTFRDLQDSVLANLHAGVQDSEQRCALLGNLDASALSFTVDDPAELSRGVVEIDSELMWVRSVDEATGVVTLSPFGRGYSGSAATTHASGTMVTASPRYPRKLAAGALRDTLDALYPDLFQPKVYEGNLTGAVTTTYPVPADCGWIIRIEWQSVGPSGQWVTARRWKFDPSADTIFDLGSYPELYTAAYGSGGSAKSVDVFDPTATTRTLKITYAAPLGGLSADSDLLVNTGLGEDCRDLLVFGATSRLLQSLEPVRLQDISVEQQQRAQLSPNGTATSASRAYWQLFQQRLMEQTAQLQRLYPATSHMTR